MRLNRASVIPLAMTLLLLVASLGIVIPLHLDRPPLPPEEYSIIRMFRETLNDTNNEFQYTLPNEAVQCDVDFISTNGSPVSLRVHNDTNNMIELQNITDVHTNFKFSSTASYTYYVTVTRQTQQTVNFSLILFLWFQTSSQPQPISYEGSVYFSILAAIFMGIGISWFAQKAARLHSLEGIWVWRGKRFRSDILPILIMLLILMSALNLYPLIAGLIDGDFEKVYHKEILKREEHSLFLDSENPVAWVNITIPNVYTGLTTDDFMPIIPPPIYLRLFDISTNGEPILVNRTWEHFILYCEVVQHNWWIEISTSSGNVLSLEFERIVSDVELSFSAEVYHYTDNPLVNPIFTVSSVLLGGFFLVFSLLLTRHLGIEIQSASNQK